jgi:hypothetical protein
MILKFGRPSSKQSRIGNLNLAGIQKRLKEEGKECRDKCFPTRRYNGHYITLIGRVFGGWRLAGSGPISRVPTMTIIRNLFSLILMGSKCWWDYTGGQFYFPEQH